MIIQYRLFFLMLIVGSSLSISGQKLYMAMENLPAAAKRFQQDNHITSIPILYASDFDPEDDGVYDEALLRTSIGKKIPDKNYQGIAVIDWEDPLIGVLEKADSASNEFRTAMSKYKALLQLCKMQRPNAKWGYYGMPFTSYWDSTRVEMANRKIIALLQEVDVLLPSLYSYYPNNTPQTNNYAYVAANTRNTAQLAKALNKPFDIFIWHRYHPSNQEFGMKTIPQAEFKNWIQVMIAACKPVSLMEGIIWWGADDYYYRTGNKNLAGEVGTKNFEKYQSDLIRNYGTMCQSVLNSQ